MTIGLLAAAAFAMSPVTAAKKGLTKRKADKRYINVQEKAADADLLDGQDSSAFLGASAKVVAKEVSLLATSPNDLGSGYTTIIDLASVHTGGADERLVITAQSRILASAAVSLHINTASDRATCRLTLGDASGTEAISEEHAVDGGAGTDDADFSVPLHGGVIRPPGTYDVDAECHEGTEDVEALNADLIVWAVPV